MKTPRDLIPVTVLTGFLGSGKTTILSRLVRDPAFADTAVILNEFGEVGLDHLLVEKTDETIVDLSCGCVCCTIRGDLTETLSALWRRREAGTIRPFRRVVIETTGLADPAPVIHTLMQEPGIFDRYRLARVVAAVDAVNGGATLDRQPEAVKQAAVADTLLVTKTDIAGGEAVSALETRLRRLNPTAARARCIDGAIAPDVLFDGGVYDPASKGAEVAAWLEAEDDDPHADRHGDAIVTYSIGWPDAIGRGALSMFLQLLADQRGDDLLRVKGLVALADDPSRPAVVHGVQHVVHPIRRLEAWPGGVGSTRLVFIVRNISKDWIEARLRDAAESPYAMIGPV